MSREKKLKNPRISNTKIVGALIREGFKDLWTGVTKHPFRTLGVLVGVSGIAGGLTACNKEAEPEQIVMEQPADTATEARLTADEFSGLLKIGSTCYVTESREIDTAKKDEVVKILKTTVGEANEEPEILSGTLVQRDSSKEEPISLVIKVKAGAQNALVSAKTKLSGNISSEDFRMDLDAVADTLIDAYNIGELRSFATNEEYVAPNRTKTFAVETSILQYTVGKSCQVSTKLTEETVSTLKSEFKDMLKQSGDCSLVGVYVVDKNLVIDGTNSEGQLVRRTMACSDDEIAAFNAKTSDVERLSFTRTKCFSSEDTASVVPEEQAGVPAGTAVLGDDFVDLIAGETIVSMVELKAPEQEEQLVVAPAEMVEVETTTLNMGSNRGAMNSVQKKIYGGTQDPQGRGYSHIPPKTL